MNVLRPGVYVRCSFCGIETWYHVDDLKQEVRCGGCGHGRSIGAEREWHYALNSLAQMGAASGQLAAMQALGALASHATHSFFFSPSLELFVEGSERPWHEIDLAALVDGNFVIGEVKEGDVTKHDFEELAEIAEALQPQRAIMFLPLEKVGPNVIKWVEETHRRLLPRGTAAQLFTLPTF